MFMMKFLVLKPRIKFGTYFLILLALSNIVSTAKLMYYDHHRDPIFVALYWPVVIIRK